jgi:CRP-like cAMP-binding protein
VAESLIDVHSFFHNFLGQVHPIDEVDWKRISSCFVSKNFKKGDYIIREGSIQKELYFIEAGIQMSFLDHGEKSHVIAFTYFPGMSAIPESFLFQKPAPCHLQCITDSKVQAISYHQLMHLFDESQAIERLFRKLAEAMLVGLIQRHLELQTLSIEERFRIFAKRSGHLFKEVPHKYLASYLHIDPTNFSKLYNSVKI